MADMPTIQLDEADILSDSEQQDVTSAPEESQQPSPEESSPEAKQSAEVAKPASETEGTAAVAADKGQSEETEQPADATEEETEQPLTGAEKRKSELQADIEQGKQQLGIDPNTEIRDLVAARNAIRQAVETRTSQVYGVPSIQDIMTETGQDESDARITAMEQREQLRDWNNTVAEAQLTVHTDSLRVLRDFPMFDASSPQFDQQSAAEAAQVLEANLIRDPNVPEVLTDPASGRPYTTGKGMIVGYRATPYQIYQPIANAHARALAQAQKDRVEGRIEGQRSAEKMLAAAEPQSSAVPKQPKEDPFLAGLTKGLKGRG